MTDFMKADLEGPADVQIIILLGFDFFRAQLFCGNHGNIVLRVFPADYRIVKFIFILRPQIGVCEALRAEEDDGMEATEWHTSKPRVWAGLATPAEAQTGSPAIV